MADEPIPLWKRNLALATTSEKRALGAATRAAKVSVKHALLNAFDKLGNESFFIQLGNGSAEDKRCLAMILAKLVPLEVQGSLDHSLTVHVVTQLGEPQELKIGPGYNLRHPKDAGPGQLPVAIPAVGARVPEDADG